MKILRLASMGLVLSLAACDRTDTADANFAEPNSIEASTNDTATGATAASIDPAFIKEAMEGDNAEVAIGQLAQAQGTSPKVKDFGKVLAEDHGAHKQELSALAGTAGLPVTDELSAEAKGNLDKLKALKGAEFDKEFKTMMVQDHQKHIAKYEKQAASGDAQTAALAQKTLPTLRKHLELAKGL
ncbi:MAG: DUF4142 domain-containing protein [Sphingomicrobium sp.]